MRNLMQLLTKKKVKFLEL